VAAAGGDAPFGGPLGWGDRPALVVVDVCRAYVEPGSPLYGDAFVTALGPIRRLVHTARSAGVPVVFTRVEYEPGGADGGVFYRKVPALACFDRGNALGDWVDGGPAPAPGEVVVTKQYASAFFGTSLASTLHSAGADTVVVCGYSTSGCIRATALDACQHGFAPMVVEPAVADREPEYHRRNLADLHAKYADVVTLDDAIAHLAPPG
jgi:nicotinamidase-related amidase